VLPLERHSAVQDDQLVARLRAGDPAAFAALFQAHYAPMVRFVFRYVGSVDVAEDIAQEVMLRVWERREALDPARSLKALLFTAARRDALKRLSHDDVVRAHADRVLGELGPSPETSPDPTPDVLLAESELARLAADRVANLSPRLRELYHLRRAGLSPVEVAEVLQISVNTVYVQHAKLLRLLRPTFEAWMRE